MADSKWNFKVMANDTLSVTDNRTGKAYELKIENGCIRSMDLRQIKTGEEDFGLMAYDPAYTNTASCRSSITYVDGDAGVLQHRGYPIEQLCERSSYLEVAYLLINGALPTQEQLTGWVNEITIHTFVHENVKDFMQGFRYDANPMGMLVASVGALSTFYPDANRIHEERVRAIQIIRLLAKMPTLAAFAFRHNMGQPYVYPDNELSYAGNFLGMMYKMTELKYEPDPRLERALDVLFILHADHEQNASTSAVRSVGSTQVDPYSAVAGGVAALYGPLHGGANEAALRLLARIETVEALEALYGPVGEASTVKVADRITPEYRAIIEASPFLALATAGPEGLDCSPRGDRPGFVRVADERTLLLPDRRGNNRVDSLRNIVRDPRVALMMLVPGSGNALRLNGRAYLDTDAALLESFAVDGKAPRSVMVIAVGEVYF